MSSRLPLPLHLSCLLVFTVSSSLLAQNPAVHQVSYSNEIAPLLKKYCAGCHNDADHEGEFSLESYSSLLRGTKKGPAFLASDPQASLIYRLITSETDSQMPPAEEPQPSESEIEIVRLWIEQGARGPSGAEPDRLMLNVPKIKSETDRSPVTAIDWSPDGKSLAVAKYAEVQLVSTDPPQSAKRLTGFPGKVTSVHFCLNGTHLITSSGVTGLGGVATLWNLETGEIVREFKGHSDLMFDAAVSPDHKLLATCSYDRSILLWNLDTGEQLRKFAGHNGAVYDLEFSPDGQTLVSASADATCKLWRVSDGERLDTLGQPLKEQYRVCFSPDGQVIAAGGADNRIRIWNFVSKQQPQINPIRIARFAHEGPIVSLNYTPDGKHLVSISEDKTIKVWETENYTENQLIEDEPEVAMALATSPDSQQFAVGRLDGVIEYKKILPGNSSLPENSTSIVISPQSGTMRNTETIKELEPNTKTQNAQVISLPALVTGIINQEGPDVDADTFRFSAKAGEEWVFEIDAERSKSKLDSIVEVLDAQGKPIERLLLQAVRDSYFTFRGKTADQSNDFRLFNWQEMELNEYLYANGEVVKLWLYPRGPDSGFDVYPGSGKRWAYFDTTSLAHALGEPCYIVIPHSPGTELIPNGLPVFKVYNKNDDESQRTLGKDSKLIFRVPADGDYLVRVRDVRGLDGSDFHYKLSVRQRKQDFSVNLVEKSLTIPAGGSKEFRLNATRLDQFDGPIEIEFTGLPEGYQVSNPIIIQAGQTEAYGVVSVSKGAKALGEEALKNVKIKARGIISGETLPHEVTGFKDLKIDDAPKLQIEITSAPLGVQALPTQGDGPLEFEIEPGETIMLQVNANRLDHKGEISFGKEDAGRNLPHGLYVDNIGLNGLLLLENQNQREFFVTAAKWVPEQTRLFHLRTTTAGGPATQPVLLHIRHKSQQREDAGE